MRNPERKFDWLDAALGLLGIAALAGVILLMCGCNSTHFSVTKPDGTTVHVANSRLFWSTEGYAMTITSNTASLSATKTSADAAALGAVAEGVARGMATSIK